MSRQVLINQPLNVFAPGVGHAWLISPSQQPSAGLSGLQKDESVGFEFPTWRSAGQCINDCLTGSTLSTIRYGTCIRPLPREAVSALSVLRQLDECHRQTFLVDCTDWVLFRADLVTVNALRTGHHRKRTVYDLRPSFLHDKLIIKLIITCSNTRQSF